jgi:two-component system chemotaxis sensor kinase CheA
MDNARDLVKIQTNAIRCFRQQKIASVRGHIFPLASLDELLDSTETSDARSKPDLSIADQASVAVAIIHANELQYGLIVDQFVTEVEVIIKPLSGELAHLRIFLGATIMGDGRLVLVLNPAELFQYFNIEKKNEQPQPSQTVKKSRGPGLEQAL